MDNGNSINTDWTEQVPNKFILNQFKGKNFQATIEPVCHKTVCFYLVGKTNKVQILYKKNRYH